MRTIKLVIAYDGTSYAGWQRQKEVRTIQQVMEESVEVMTGQNSCVHGAGRTDAGVHALGMTAHFLTDALIPCIGFLKGLNSILPEDIRILSVEDAAAGFHSRFSALGKSYHYNFVLSPVLLPTERLYNAHLCQDKPFYFDGVAECLETIVGSHDFSSFEAAGSRDADVTGGQGAVREIFSARLFKRDAHKHYAIEISGNGFLRHMVRNIVGTLFEVGSGKRSVRQFRETLAGKDRSMAGPTAPAKGLFLKEVYYDSPSKVADMNSTPNDLL